MRISFLIVYISNIRFILINIKKYLCSEFPGLLILSNMSLINYMIRNTTLTNQIQKSGLLSFIQ